MRCSERFLFIEELTAKSRFRSWADMQDILSVGGGLLIHPVLFVLTPIHLFSVIWLALICTTTPHLQAIVHQECTTIGNSRVQGGRAIEGPP